MGLQDLLAVVLGVKTAEALQERRVGKQDVAFMQSQIAKGRFPTAESAATFFPQAYQEIEDIIIDDLARALNSGADPDDALVKWAGSARINLTGPRKTMRMCLGWNPTADPIIERILETLEAYKIATLAFSRHQPDGRDLLDRAVSQWEVVRSMVEAMGSY